MIKKTKLTLIVMVSLLVSLPSLVGAHCDWCLWDWQSKGFSSDEDCVVHCLTYEAQESSDD
ncbi:MAG: hypothetical protein B7Y25_01720 [Alphaproteobacteria bacterium 16-39-46]|nr:MAG: hypothetical protein B7Y25_01720 [Alphaproteobacteria bacterium 16-39-46]OZA43959.1 MAG: hypothetical protein B7X84_01705 [Alphaproteobacteria bacterium 17-39-52]HQS83462.1 hypothetical protein [Alphaproteobacteria bacterium]HQS93256.1 hypothetical protein [Alphaproteobacteria bacterium]